jgi:hypothetical protein
MSSQEELRGEALRRAWLNASYRVGDYQAGTKEVSAISNRTLVIVYALGALCWAIIGAGMWLVWRAF